MSATIEGCDEVVERFCFEFKNNPLAYKDGGNILSFTNAVNNSSSSSNPNITHHTKGILNSYYDQTSANFVDDMEIVRLHGAERIIHREITRLANDKAHQRKIGQEQESRNYAHPSISYEGASHNNNTGYNLPPINASYEKSSSAGQLGSNASNASDQEMGTPKKTTKVKKNANGAQIFNPKKVKLERVATLLEEAGELKAMMSHLEDQMNTLVEQHEQMAVKKKHFQGKHKEAISVISAHMQQLSSAVKDLHREQYFVQLERKRKTGVVQTLRDEMEESKRREALKKKIEKKIKKEEGLLAALQSFSGPTSKSQL
eukprot:gene33432-41255_t